MLQSKISPNMFDDESAVNLMRDDIAEEFMGQEELLNQAPSREGNFIKVKSVLE